jgi:hypothetical protein
LPTVSGPSFTVVAKAGDGSSTTKQQPPKKQFATKKMKNLSGYDLSGL